ncbi:MAG TPA: universal stress protein [Anaerolineae bacterium]|nr:universal stress protein [Anaerolineae bacterium]
MGKLLSMRKVRNILILVAIDGSDSSKNALRQTIKFAKKERCGITAVTVIPSYEGELELGLMSNIKDSFKEPGEKLLAEASQIAKEEGADLYTILAEGNIHEAIIDVAESRDCDLIVMGRRGLTNFERAFMGSVTARVIGYSPIDVLVMPHNSVIKWDNMLLAVDGSKHSDIAANRAISIAQAYRGELNALSVVDVTDEFFVNAPHAVEQMVKEAKTISKEVETMAQAARVRASSFVREGEAHEKIIGMAEELKANVICMGSHGRTGLRRLLMGSVTEKVIGNAPCPVLIIKSY